MTGTATSGRTLNRFLEQIMSEIGSGRYQRGSYLPSTRTLAELYDTSAETARRGLKVLEEGGYLTSEGRSGFRVALEEGDRSTRPIAFVTTVDPNLPAVQPATAAIFLALQQAGARRGSPLLCAHAGAGGAGAVAAQLRASNTWGTILDTINPALYAAVVRFGLPTVMVNSWIEDSPVSTVLQDNYRGGYLAAEYLLKQGAKRIGWVGPLHESCHSRERLAGASACLKAVGSAIEEADCVGPAGGGSAERVDALLGRSDRPDAILALGQGSPAAVKRAADRLGLVVGRDFEMVCWVPEECYESHYLPIFRGGAAAPAIVWSAAAMTERALALLADVADGRVEEAVRLLVPTKLKVEG